MIRYKSKKQYNKKSRKQYKSKKKTNKDIYFIDTQNFLAKNPFSRSTQIVNISQKNGVKIFVLGRMMSDEEIADKEGRFFDAKDFKYIVKEDADGYRVDENGTKHLLFRFRKNVIPNKLSKIGMKYLKKPAMKKHDNRGAAAGVLDLKKLPGYVDTKRLEGLKGKFRVKGFYSNVSGKYIKHVIGNLSQSNIIGYFDRADRNLGKGAPPCRKTAFTAQQVEKWREVVPLIQAIDKQFKILVPNAYKKQYNRAHKTKFVISGTAFSTLTINYNWRTALHKDAGDFSEGFGNLVVLEEGKYNGGYTGFPQYGVAIDVREGDFLAMDVHQWHANTKIVRKTKNATRLSLVSYLREKMIRCSDM